MIHVEQKGTFAANRISSHHTEAHGYCKGLTLSLAIPNRMSYRRNIHDNPLMEQLSSAESGVCTGGYSCYLSQPSDPCD
jgi:hypothetical protein